MEISCNNHVKEIVTGLWWNGAPVDEVYLDGEKLYPLEGTVATQVLIDVTPDAFPDGLNYWIHALDFRHEIESIDEIFYQEISGPMKTRFKNWVKWVEENKKKGYTLDPNDRNRMYKKTSTPVSLFTLTIGSKTYTEGKDFTFNPNTGLITFTGKQLPELSALPVGSKLKIKASVRERAKKQEWCYEGERIYNLPLLKGTTFYCTYWKGGKKEPGGMILTVKGLPSNQQFVKAEGNQAGHWRGTVAYITPPRGLGNHDGWNKCVYKDEWVKGDLQFHVKVERHMGGGQSAYPIYPAFTKEWSLNVIGVVIKQL